MAVFSWASRCAGQRPHSDMAIRIARQARGWSNGDPVPGATQGHRHIECLDRLLPLLQSAIKRSMHRVMSHGSWVVNYEQITDCLSTF
ncbi:hypothetical protein TMEC50S_00298 [Thauera mechernichensis]